MTERFRCAITSAQRGDDLAGTASTVRAYLLVECIGSWGSDALRDSRLPEDTKRVLRSARRVGVRANLVRRHRVTARRAGIRIFAAYADPVRPWMESTVLGSPAEVADLDLTSLGAGRSPGLEPVTEPVFGVCTHGRHDACCAELGRPVATALSEAQPDATWEISHIGGDRFAGNVLVLPHGLYYGRVDAPTAVALAAGHRAGELDLDHLRGRSSYQMPVQAAEIALRRQLGETRLDTVRLVERNREEDRWTAVFLVGADRWEVVVQTERDDDERHRLTCLAARPDAIPQHRLVGIRRLD